MLLAALQRIEQELRFAQSCHESDDTLGQPLILQGLADDLIATSFLTEIVCRLYLKRVGCAFSDQEVRAELATALAAMLSEVDAPQPKLWELARGIFVGAYNTPQSASPMPEPSMLFHNRACRVFDL